MPQRQRGTEDAFRVYKVGGPALEDPELLEDPEDQPAPDAVAGSSSETSLMPASAASPAGMLR